LSLCNQPNTLTCIYLSHLSIHTGNQTRAHTSQALLNRATKQCLVAYVRPGLPGPGGGIRARLSSTTYQTDPKSLEWAMCGLRMGSWTVVPLPEYTCARREIAVGWGLSSHEMSTPTRRHTGEERSCSGRSTARPASSNVWHRVRSSMARQRPFTAGPTPLSFLKTLCPCGFFLFLIPFYLIF